MPPRRLSSRAAPAAAAAVVLLAAALLLCAACASADKAAECRAAFDAAGAVSGIGANTPNCNAVAFDLRKCCVEAKAALSRGPADCEHAPHAWSEQPACSSNTAARVCACLCMHDRAAVPPPCRRHRRPLPHAHAGLCEPAVWREVQSQVSSAGIQGLTPDSLRAFARACGIRHSGNGC